MLRSFAMRSLSVEPRGRHALNDFMRFGRHEGRQSQHPKVNEPDQSGDCEDKAEKAGQPQTPKRIAEAYCVI